MRPRRDGLEWVFGTRRLTADGRVDFLNKCGQTLGGHRIFENHRDGNRNGHKILNYLFDVCLKN